MSRITSVGLAVLLALLALAGVGWLVAGSASAAPSSQADPGPFDPPRQERDTSPQAPGISFIDSPSPVCYRPQPQTDVCYINWYYLYVSSSPAYMITMTVRIDDVLRANYQGFFQTYMYVPYDMNGRGFRVACGTPGSGGVPDLGRSYPYILRARDSSGLKAANYGSVTCPADIVPAAAVSLSGVSHALVGVSYPFTASVSPITATLPLTYSWQVAQHPSRVVTGSLANTQSFAWSLTGAKVMTVTASNSLGTASAVHLVTVHSPVAGLAASNNGPKLVGRPVTLSASVSGGASVTYTWDFGDGHTGSGAIANHTYASPGVYTAEVTASNPVSSLSATTSVTILQELKTYLPLTLRRH